MEFASELLALLAGARAGRPALRRAGPVPLTDHADCVLVVIDVQPGFALSPTSRVERLEVDRLARAGARGADRRRPRRSPTATARRTRASN